MAIQKALITNKTDFIRPGLQSAPINSFLYINQEDIPASATVVGAAPTYVDGVRGKAIQHGGATAIKWANQVYPNASKHMVSFWIKPTTTDLTGWKILASHRGDGYGTNYGFHIALYDGKLNVRIYGEGGSVNLYTDGTDFPLWTFSADTLYHVGIIFDEGAAEKLQVFVNKSKMLYSYAIISLNGFTRSFTVGDMLSSAGGLQYCFDGMIDEVIYALDGDVWDETQMDAYYDGIMARDFVDYWTTPGSIQLPDDGAGQFVSGTRTWESAALDLGAAVENGRVQLNYDQPAACALTISTRTSDDASVWEPWATVREDGYIDSAPKRYIQIKAEMSTNLLTATPRVDEIQILSYEGAEKLPLINQPLKIYKDLASGLEYSGELLNAYDIIIEEEINGENLLTFKLPINDPKRAELGDQPVELVAEIADRRYIIREVIDERSEDGKLYTSFKCEAFFYELRDFKVMTLELSQVSAYTAIDSILKAAVPATDWKIVRCDIPGTKLRDLKVEWKSVLESIRSAVDTWGGEILFDDVTKEISLVSTFGADNGVRFHYNKNLKRIVRNVDTYDLITRLYPYGKGNLDIKTVNGGVDYIEDTTWVDALGLRNRVRVGRWKDESYLYPQNLKDDATFILQGACKPQVSYALTVQDLSILSGHEHESFNLGDTTYTVDVELLSAEIQSRIVRRKYNVREPWKTIAELAQPKKLLSDAMRKNVDDKMEYLDTAELLNTEDTKQMTVFNYLLNSRADEGLNDWLQEGTDFNLENSGFSGDWAFKCVGGYGKTNKLTQRVFGVSHRSAYTVSAAVATEGNLTRGGTIAEPFVGVKVVIHYKDGTSETKLLAIDDSTN